MKDKGEDYFFLLFFLQEHSYFYDDCWRYCFFCFSKEKDKKVMLKNDKKIRNKMIQKEIKTKKYLIKNDFDVLKGFREFLHELNKSLVFKLSKKHERDDVMQLFVKIMQEENLVLIWMESMWLKKILIKNYIVAHKIEDEIKYICYL